MLVVVGVSEEVNGEGRSKVAGNDILEFMSPMLRCLLRKMGCRGTSECIAVC